uniref:Uncharacterized protein n=1 Tax=Cucumis melo TaxID=3656 RepID=A0A9I9DJ95_CUCME
MGSSRNSPLGRRKRKVDQPNFPFLELNKRREEREREEEDRADGLTQALGYEVERGAT